eukprot:10098505-Lingulodinium_polyedra.AAC.1
MSCALLHAILYPIVVNGMSENSTSYTWRINDRELMQTCIKHTRPGQHPLNREDLCASWFAYLKRLGMH